MDAIQQQLINYRLLAAKDIYSLYGSYIGQNGVEYQILNGGQPDKNGFLTVKNMTTGSINTGFDPLGVGLVSTTPPTTSSLTSLNPSSNNPSAFSPTTLLSIGGTVTPLLTGVLGKKGNAGTTAGGPGGKIAYQSPAEFFASNSSAGAPGSFAQVLQADQQAAAAANVSLSNAKNALDVASTNASNAQKTFSTYQSQYNETIAGINQNYAKDTQAIKLEQANIDAMLNNPNSTLTVEQRELYAQKYMADSIQLDDLAIQRDQALKTFNDNYTAAEKQVTQTSAALDEAKTNFTDAQAFVKNISNTNATILDDQAAYAADVKYATNTYINNTPISDAEWAKAQSELAKQKISKPDDQMIAEQVKADRTASVLSTPLTSAELSQVSQGDIQNYLDKNGFILDSQVTYDANAGVYFDAEGTPYWASQVASINEATYGAGLDLRNVNYQSKLNASTLSGEQTQFLGSLAGLVGAGYGLFESIFSMTENGKATAKGVVGAIGSMVGLVMTLHYMHLALTQTTLLLNKLNNLFSNIPILNAMHLGSIFKFLSSGWGTLLIMAAVTLLAVLLGRKSPDDQALTDFNQDVAPTVWSPSVMMVTAGLALTSMGIQLGPNAAMTQQIPVPQIQLNKALQSAVGSLPTASARYGTAFVQQGTNGQPTIVFYLTPGGTDSHGNAMDVVHAVQLKSGLTFSNPGSNGYIPFFVTGAKGSVSPNPAAVTAVASQSQLLTAAGAVTTANAQTATSLAAGADKTATPNANGN